MNRQLLGEIWNWLPAFRAVAETEHLPTAARRMHVTTPALSRTIRLLEDHLGHEVFNRTGRSLVLNSAGKRLLEAVQRAMRDVDLALSDITTDPFAGPIHVASLGVLTNHFVLPALLGLTEAHPELHPVLGNHRTTEANDLLVRGRLDAAFYYEAVAPEDLHVERIGETTASVYCGQAHPLFDAVDVPLEELLRWPFSVPAIGDTGQFMDGWPVDVPRKIGMQITLLTTNLAICRSGRFLTVLPDVAAYEAHQAGELRRFPFELIDPIAIYAACRADVPPERPARALIDAVRAEIDTVQARLAPLRRSAPAPA